MEPFEVQVKDVKAGDSFVHEGEVQWTAVDDADTGSMLEDEHAPKTTTIRVQHKPDGGISIREWANPLHVIQVTREDEG